MTFKGILLSAALVLAPITGTAFAQEVVGRALVEGKMVEIMSDRTWRFEGEDGAPSANTSGNTADKVGCSAIHARVTFCADPNLWTSSPPANADIVAAYRHDDRHYGQFIVEGFGSKDGLTSAQMRDIVVTNAAGATGQAKEEIVILDVYATSVDGVSGETVVYLVEFDGLKVVFANTIVIQDDLVMQAITYAVNQSFGEKHQGLHRALIDNTLMN